MVFQSLGENRLLSPQYSGKKKITPFCSSCGRQVDENTVFCPACGNRLVQASPSTMPSPPPFVPPVGAATQPSFGDADRRAVAKLKIYAILLLVAVIASFPLTFGYFVLFPLRRTTTSATISNVFLTVTLISIVLGAIQLLGITQLRSA
ncbi:MAG TPA: zinc ribbon domain-containing protein [Nitrososphaerales archaeon]|nr:zinc ribbon domain-containing protein [Nitrososphaerales archaeon]